MRYGFLLLLLFFAMPASALSLPGIENYIDYQYTTNQYDGITQYNYAVTTGAIVKVTHTIDYNTAGTETYVSKVGVIKNSYSCNQHFLYVSCSYNLTFGSQGVSYTEYDLTVLNRSIVTSVVNNNDNGSLGIGEKVFESVSCLYDPLHSCDRDYDSIIIPGLAYAPIYQVYGTANHAFSIKFDTVDDQTYANYVGKTAQQSTESNIGMLLTMWHTGSSIAQFLFSFLIVLAGNPVLFFAMVEAFAMMSALDSKNMYSWWKNWIGFHFKAYDWISEKVNWFIEMITRLINALKPI